MKTNIPLLGLLAICALSPVAFAQNASSDGYSQRIIYVDVHPGKNAEWRDLVEETVMKVAQARANAGEILSWTLLRSVHPSGEEARSDYMISVISDGLPRAYEETFANSLEPAGSSMSFYEWSDKSAECSTRVGSELWQIQIYNGSAQVGNYISLNLMRVHDWDTIGETTQTWSPMSKEMIKRGSITGWVFSTKRFPAGADTPYRAYSANIYPNFEAVFRNAGMADIFEKVHPRLDRGEYQAKLRKARDIANRELWRVVERVSKSD